MLKLLYPSLIFIAAFALAPGQAAETPFNQAPAAPPVAAKPARPQYQMQVELAGVKLAIDHLQASINATADEHAGLTSLVAQTQGATKWYSDCILSPECVSWVKQGK